MRLILMTTLMLALGGGIALAQAPSGAAPSRSAPPSAAPGPGTNSSAQSRDNRTGKNAADEEYADCMRLWDKATHMTRQEWSRTCRRVQSRLDQVRIK
jgi:hypothetical protein